MKKKRKTLAEANSELAKQWHPTKNGELTPADVSASSKDEVWWLYPYDDPQTGRHFDFEWQARIANRVKAKGVACPFLSGKAVWPGFNDLASQNPELAKQWHPTKNGELKATDVTLNSNKKVWWYLPYDDPITGKHFDFEWEISPNSRRINGCPFLNGKAVWPGFNDLAAKAPELAKQWHPTKNGELKATDVTLNSNKKVWWLFPYDDPETGKHFDFEWQAKVEDRVKSPGCPFLRGKAAWPGFNDLATKGPELAKQWHPTKNGDLKATDVTLSSNKKVWWLFPYDDLETGKHFDFEWQAKVEDRVKKPGCPFLNGQAVWPGYNDLATRKPDLAKQWHPTKNGDLKETDISIGSNKKVWWVYPHDDPETGKHFDFEWRASVKSMAKASGCPFLSGKAVWPGFNDLAAKAPELAKQWHPTKNGELKATDVTLNSNKKVWWLFPYDDPETGRHFDFEWQASVKGRVKSSGCPFLSGQAVWPGFNDLATNNPDLAKQWHPTKNGELKATDVALNSGQKVWWLYPYDDPETGKHFDFEWQSVVRTRVRSPGCPFLNGQSVWSEFNDLAFCYPALAEEWHPTKNRKRTPQQVYKNSQRKYWWQCGTCGHAWFAQVCRRVSGESECRQCAKNS